MFMIDLTITFRKINDSILRIPCINTSLNQFSSKEVWALCEQNEFLEIIDSLKKTGANIQVYDHYEYIHSAIKPNCGLIFPPCVSIDDDSIEAYYKVIDYYFKFLQMITHKMYVSKSDNVLGHLIIVLPCGSSNFSNKLAGMAYFSISGLIKGLAKMYADKGIVCCGLELGTTHSKELLTEWICFLSSENSNNIIGDLIKL